MKTDCATCQARAGCSVEVVPGSFICLFNQQYDGKTHADCMAKPLSCDGCRNETKQVNEMPCCNCIRCPKADHYEPED